MWCSPTFIKMMYCFALHVLTTRGNEPTNSSSIIYNLVSCNTGNIFLNPIYIYNSIIVFYTLVYL